MFQIPVKMGSRRLSLEMDSKSTIKSEHFIELALKKCKLNDKLTRTYAVFESVSGIERLLTSDDNICDLWRVYSIESRKQTEFIIRKCLPVEQKLTSKTMVTNEKRTRMIKKCYEQINQQQTKQDLFAKIVQNEQELHKQAEKLQQVEQLLANLNQKQQQATTKPMKTIKKRFLNENNVNFLQFLNHKIKKQTTNQNKSYEKLIENSCCEESSDSEENYDLKRTSTSTLESLI